MSRISGLVYEDTRSALKTFLKAAIRDSATYAEHARRKTVTAGDVVHALERQGRTLYGFDSNWRTMPTARRRRPLADICIALPALLRSFEDSTYKVPKVDATIPTGDGVVVEVSHDLHVRIDSLKDPLASGKYGDAFRAIGTAGPYSQFAVKRNKAADRRKADFVEL